jgi:hypothetical protein
MERKALFINARFRPIRPLVAPPRPRQAGRAIDLDQDGRIGLQTLARNAIEIPNHRGIEAASATLISQRGICEPVTQDYMSMKQSGPNYLLDILRPAAEIKQQFGASMDRRVRRIEQNPPDLPPDFGAARLDRFDYRPSGFTQFRGQQAQLRRLAAAVHTFECDEAA